MATEREKILLSIGLREDTEQNQKVLNAILEEIRKVFNQEFGFEIKQGDFDTVIQKLQEVTGSAEHAISTVKNSAGEVTRFSTSFKSSTDALITLNGNLNTTIKTIDQIHEEMGEAFGQQTIRDIIKAGEAVDAAGKKVTDARKTSQVSGTVQVESDGVTTAYINQSKQAIEEVIKQYQILQKLQSQMTGSGWEEIAKQIESARAKLNQYVEENEQIMNSDKLQQVVKAGEVNVNTKAFEQIVDLQNRIAEIQKQETTADGVRLEKLQQHEQALQAQLNKLTEIYNVSNEMQQTHSTDIQTEEELNSIITRRAQLLQENQDRNTADVEAVQKEQEKVEITKQLTDNYKQQLQLQQQINSLDPVSNKEEVELLNTQLEDLRAIASDTRVYAQEQEHLKDVVTETTSEFQKQLELQEARGNDDSWINSFEKLKENLEEQEKIQERLNKMDPYKDQEASTQLTFQLDALRQQEGKLQEIVGENEQVSRLYQEHSQALAEINAIGNDNNQARLLAEYSKNLNEQLQVQKQINKLNEDTNANELAVLQERLAALQQTGVQIRANLDETQALTKLEEHHVALLAQSNSHRNDSEDTNKIKEAIDLTQQLRDAELELFEIQKKHGTNTAIDEARQSVIALQSALREATSAQLSNGEAVQQSARYTKEATKINQEYESSLRGMDDKYKSCTVSLGKMIESIRETAQNVIQYNIAWNMFQNIDRYVEDSIKKIRELDTAMTEVQMVTNQSNESVRQTMNAYADLGVQLGATTMEIAEGSVEWLKYRSL